MFEFDDNKSRANAEKHGINFIEAQKMWEDPYLLEIAARTEDEPRNLIIGKIGKVYWSAIVTYRNSNIRIISVRHSRKEEINIYESY
ncbi:MAG: BrnT family toxin [Candidatus Kapabacteria bacterium]|nr:BrnT family toxin [Candidatus Kapabacteria bacterium]